MEPHESNRILPASEGNEEIKWTGCCFTLGGSFENWFYTCTDDDEIDHLLAVTGKDERKHQVKIGMILKRTAWIAAVVLFTCWILLLLGCAGLWYIPLQHVDSANELEDYLLWWGSLTGAVFTLPLWLLAARQAVRQFRGKQWLKVSSRLPWQLTAAIPVLLGLAIWQLEEARARNAWIPYSEVPEYTEAAVLGYQHRGMILMLAVIWLLCLLARQRRARPGRKMGKEDTDGSEANAPGIGDEGGTTGH